MLEESVIYVNSRVDHPADNYGYDDFESFCLDPPNHPDDYEQMESKQTVRFDDLLEYEDADLYAKDNLNDHFFDQPSTLNVTVGDQFLHSDSENFAITCDLSNDAEFLKSPTIESISGKSFDENMSPHDDHNHHGLDFTIPSEKLKEDGFGQISDKLTQNIERNFERISNALDYSDLHDGEEYNGQTTFGGTGDAIIVGEIVDHPQNDLSTISWDDSQTTIILDPNPSTTDNDRPNHEGDMEFQATG